MRLKACFFCLAAAAFCGGCVREELKTVDVFFTADAEGVYWSRPEPRLENREAGGYAVLKNFLDRQQDPFLFFDGGNWFGSAPESSMTKGAYVAELARTLPYTAGTVSDKDFIFGWASLRSVIRELPYPFVVSNLKLDGQIPWPMHDYQIRSVNGVKFGIFALVNPQAVNQNKSRLPGFRAQDALESAQKMTALLREKGVDYIILLSSLGDADPSGLGDAALAEEVFGIDLILSSNKSREAAETEQINQTFIVYPGSKLDGVARVRLFFDKNRRFRRLVFHDEALLKESFGENEEISSRAASLLENTREQMNARVAETREEIATALSAESALGDLLAQCLHRWAKLDGAVLNSDSIRAPLPAGRLSEFDLYKTYPYGDNITFVTMKGEAFKRALEASLEAKDNFPQIAGFSVTYDLAGPSGNKIKQIVLDGGRILRSKETYRFAVTDHIMAGGFGHDAFIDSLEFKSTFVNARQIMRSCLMRQKKVEAPKQDRWRKAG